jgi:ABC-type sulfate transport system substrate-binding protein
MSVLADRIAEVVNAFWHMTNLANSESDVTRERLIDELHAAVAEAFKADDWRQPHDGQRATAECTCNCDNGYPCDVHGEASA